MNSLSSSILPLSRTLPLLSTRICTPEAEEPSEKPPFAGDRAVAVVIAGAQRGVSQSLTGEEECCQG